MDFPSLSLVPSHLSASEKNPNSPSNFKLQLNYPLLSRLENCCNMRQLQQIHAQMITTGLVHETFAASRIIAFCAFSLHGDLNYALNLFNRIESRNLFIWNAMIRAFSRSNCPEKSLIFYSEMFNFGCNPDSYTFPFVLKSCVYLSAVSEGQQIHAHVLKTGFGSDLFVQNSLIHMYAECGWVDHGRHLFDKMPERNQVSWVAMISGFVNKNRPKDALCLFYAMEWRKMKLDQITMATVLSVCAQLGDLELGREIHCYIKQEGIKVGLILCNSLIYMYVKCGCFDIAHQLFDEMPERDSVSWNILISGFAHNGNVEKCLELLFQMQMRNIRVNEATILSLVSACEQQDLAIVIHNYVRESGFEAEISICNALINMYSRIGRVDIGRKLFDKMPERDTISWNSMIAGYARHGSMEIAHILFNQIPERDNFSWSTMISGYVKQGQSAEAIKLYKNLQAEDIKLDTVMLVSILSACADLAALEEGTMVHSYLKKNKIGIDPSLGTTLIDMYAKCGSLEKAIEVFEALSVKDVFQWTALISGLAMHGHGKETLIMFERMKTEGAKPNSVTYLSVLSACAHGGLVEDGWRVYKIMQEDSGVELGMEHKGCLVDLLARAGKLEEAKEFIENLGSGVDVCVWGALLGACRIHGNVELGEFAFKRMLELDPLHHGAYVLMLNIYTEAGQWEDSTRMRRKMREEGILKEVGRSWIEVNGIRHGFTVEDRSHYQRKEIYYMLGLVHNQMKYDDCTVEMV